VLVKRQVLDARSINKCDVVVSENSARDERADEQEHAVDSKEGGQPVIFARSMRKPTGDCERSRYADGRTKSPVPQSLPD
jgi:hypothetical protein